MSGMETILTNLAPILVNGKGTRRERLNGKWYTIAPLTLIVPGVLNGSQGPLLYQSADIALTVNDWERVPLVVYHPFHEGQPVSVTHPGILEKQGIGFLRNPHIHAPTNKLKAEGWFDEEATKRVEPRVYASLRAGKQIELSTGLFTDNIQAPLGSHYESSKGKIPYTHIATNYRPDHLAILPDQKGACSLNDGCGVLVNASAEYIRRRVANCGGVGSGVPGPCATGSNKEPAKKGSRLAGLMKAIGNKATGISVRVAGAFILKYRKMEARYGRAGAIAVMAGIVALTPVPIPGTMLAPVAVAEGIRAVHRIFKTQVTHPTPALATNLATDRLEDELTAECLDLLKMAYKVAGEQLPASITKSRVKEAIMAALVTKPAINKEFSSDEERKAAFAAMTEGSKGAGKELKDTPKHSPEDVKKADEQSAAAAEQSKQANKRGKANPGKYQRAHTRATVAHTSAAEAQRRVGNEDLAKLHDKASEDHKSRISSMVTTNVGFQDDSHRKASYKAMSGSGEKGSMKATLRSKLANRQPRTLLASKVAHTRAAKAHKYAAAKHLQLGNKGMAKLHKRAMKEHMTLAGKGIAMNRDGLIKWLTTNCECMKEPDKKAALNNMTDEQLLELKNNEEATNPSLIALNAAAADDDEDEEDVLEEEDPDALDEEDNEGTDLMEIANLLDVETDPSKDPAGFIKEFNGKLDDVKAALAIDEQQGIDPSDPSQQPQPQQQAQRPAPQPKMAPARNTQHSNQQKSTQNRGDTVSKSTFKEMLALATPEEQAVWNNAVEITNRERTALIERIVANTTEAQKKVLRPIYEGMRLDQLRAVASSVPTDNHAQSNGVGLYLGSSGTAVQNAGDDDEPLISPVINYNEKA